MHTVLDYLLVGLPFLSMEFPKYQVKNFWLDMKRLRKKEKEKNTGEGSVALDLTQE